MNNPVWITLRSQFGNRAAVAIAGAVCFTIGAGGWAAAERGGNTTKESGPSTTSQAVNAVVSTIGSTVVDSTIVDSTIVDSNIVDSTSPDTTGVSTSSSNPDSTVAATVANTTVEDSTSSSVPGNTIEDDDSTSSSAPSSTVDASTSSVPANTASSSSVPTTPLPAPFTKTYTSAGGSITVTWRGTAFSLDAVSPAPGFQAEIHDQDWDRIRVEFDNDASAWRIEIRFEDGAIREQITH